jgi:cytochrome P450
MRTALKDHTFSDGTYIPQGTALAAPAMAVHEDDKIYEDPATFNPWRFSTLRESGGESAKHQLVNTSPDVSYCIYVEYHNNLVFDSI